MPRMPAPATPEPAPIMMVDPASFKVFDVVMSLKLYSGVLDSRRATAPPIKPPPIITNVMFRFQ